MKLTSTENKTIKKAIKNLSLELKNEPFSFYKIESENYMKSCNTLIEEYENFISVDKKVKDSIGHLELFKNMKRKNTTVDNVELCGNSVKFNKIIVKHELKDLDSYNIKCNEFINFKDNKLNFYINSKIWCDKIGRKLLERDKKHFTKYSYANNLRDVDEISLFKYYVPEYKKFISVVEQEISSAQKRRAEIIIFQLDIKNYYKGISNLKFYEEIFEEAEKEAGDNEFLKMVNTLEKDVICGYLEKYGNGLAIGVDSSKIISNLYGKYLDLEILKSNPLRYARYVDDIIVVFEYTGKENIQEYIKAIITVSKNLVIEASEKSKPYRFEFNSEKTNTFIVNNNTPKQYVCEIEKSIFNKGSFKDIINNFYEVDSFMLFDTINNFKMDGINVNVNINKVKWFINYVYKEIIYWNLYASNINLFISQLHEKYGEVINNIASLLKDSDIAQLNIHWTRMLLLDEVFGKPFKLQSRIDNLDYSNYTNTAFEALKKHDYDNHKLPFNKKDSSIAVEYDDNDETKLDNCSFLYSSFKGYTYQKQLFKLYKSFNEDNENDDVEKKLGKINAIALDELEKKCEKEVPIHDYSNLVDLEIDKIKVKLLSVNSPQQKDIEEYLLNDKLPKRSEILVKMNMEITPCDNIVLLPELVIESNLINDYVNIAKRNNVIIIGGMFLKKYGNFIVNMLITIIPLSSNSRDAHIIFRKKIHVAPKEKLLIESTINPIQATNYRIPKVKENLFILKLHEKLQILSFNCYELCDIKLRASIDKNVSLITAHEYNMDIETFKNVTRSMVKDYKVYLAQINDSKYGDTGIYLPKKEHENILMRTKGGSESLLLTEFLDFEALYKARYSVDYSNKKNFKPTPPMFLK